MNICFLSALPSLNHSPTHFYTMQTLRLAADTLKWMSATSLLLHCVILDLLWAVTAGRSGLPGTQMTVFLSPQKEERGFVCTLTFWKKRLHHPATWIQKGKNNYMNYLTFLTWPKNKLQLQRSTAKPQEASNNCCHNKKSVHVSRINQGLLLWGSGAEARPQPPIGWGRADRTWCTRLPVWIHDGQVYRSGEQRGRQCRDLALDQQLFKRQEAALFFH